MRPKTETVRSTLLLFFFSYGFGCKSRHVDDYSNFIFYQDEINVALKKKKWKKRIGFLGRNGNTLIVQVVKTSKAVKGAVSQKTMRKMLFSQKHGTQRLGSFRPSFLQESVSSLGPSTPLELFLVKSRSRDLASLVSSCTHPPIHSFIHSSIYVRPNT